MGRAAGSAGRGEGERPRGDAPQLRARLPVRAPSAEGTKAAGAKESQGEARRRRSDQRSSRCREWQPRRQSLRRLPQDCLPAFARLLLIASSAGEPLRGRARWKGILRSAPRFSSPLSSPPRQENNSRQPREDADEETPGTRGEEKRRRRL